MEKAKEKQFEAINFGFFFLESKRKIQTAKL